jgi:glycosyltransferase involved in cell wall biosynthesis
VLPENFLLAVGHFEDRKNYDLLIDAIKHLKDTNSRQSLIIVGNDNGQKQRIENKLLSLNLEKNIFLFSNLTDEEVQIMYRLCSAFIFPSTYEGFGIPVLEAMAYEKPFILSNIEVFKEITENQGVYFEPLNVRSIAAAILKVCENPSISKKLQIYGKNRVKDFNFNFLAHDLKRLYMS